MFLEISQNPQENTYEFYEFSEISKNNFFTEHIQTTAPKWRGELDVKLIELIL